MNVDQIKLLVSEDLLATNHLIEETFASIDPSIVRVKCILPLITLLSCHACQYSGEDHIRLAAFSEILYTARLLHTNIDKNNVSAADKKNILIGDCLHTRYLKLMLEVGNTRIIEFMSDITCTITYGDIVHPTDIKNNALLYAATCALGGYISQESERMIGGLYQFGMHLGMGLQLNTPATQAIACLHHFPDSIYKQALTTLASECSSAW